MGEDVWEFGNVVPSTCFLYRRRWTYTFWYWVLRKSGEWGAEDGCSSSEGGEEYVERKKGVKHNDPSTCPAGAGLLRVTVEIIVGTPFDLIMDT